MPIFFSNSVAAPAAASNPAPIPTIGRPAPPRSVVTPPTPTSIEPKNNATSLPKFIMYINASIVAFATVSIIFTRTGPSAADTTARNANIFCIILTTS